MVTLAIALPLYFRPFFYLQIHTLHLPEQTGHTARELRDAFDELMNYLTLPGQEFGTGVFPSSAQGAAHFADCKVLMMLVVVLLFASLAVVIACRVLRRIGYFRPKRPFGLDVGFTVGVCALGVFSVIGLLLALNFQAAFTVFHKLFFPGKKNWVFYPDQDPIILMLPHAFFINCAALIAAVIIVWSVLLILLALLRREAPVEPGH